MTYASSAFCSTDGHQFIRCLQKLQTVTFQSFVDVVFVVVDAVGVSQRRVAVRHAVLSDNERRVAVVSANPVEQLAHAPGYHSQPRRARPTHPPIRRYGPSPYITVQIDLSMINYSNAMK